MKRSPLLITTLLCLVPAAAYAESPVGNTADVSGSATPDERTPTTTTKSRKAHEGLMLRLSGGAAAFGAGIKSDTKSDFGVGGVGPNLSIAVGTSILPNLALHLDAEAIGAAESRAGEDDEESFESDGVGMAAAGLGATYFIMPYDIGLSASFLFAKFGAETRRDETYESDAAFLGKFSVSKEWGLADHWGMGVNVSAFAGGGWGKDYDEEEIQMALGGASVNFVATYF